VISLGSGAFSECYNLTSVIVHGNITNMGYGAFGSCAHLSSLTLDGGITTIAPSAFRSCSNLVNVTLPSTVTNIGNLAFVDTPLDSILIPDGVTSLGLGAFANTRLSSVTIPGSVTNIASSPFYDCSNLTAITVDASNPAYSSLGGVLFDKMQTTVIGYPPGLVGSYTVPATVTGIGSNAFSVCPTLTRVYFTGNAPTVGANGTEFSTDHAVAYYLPGTTGWSSSLAGIPAVLWNPLIQTADSTFGVQNHQFGFKITGTTNIPIVVEACTDLALPVWTPIQTLTLTNGTFHFSDPAQANTPCRYYRIVSQ
jgi:hypothetical protein